MTTKKQRDMAAIMAMRRKDLTPYDTGRRAEPRLWVTAERGDPRSTDDYGKVDFDGEEDFTIATLYMEREADGSYTLKGYANEALKVDIESNDPTDPDLTITVVEHG